ncbi:PAS domain S-box-containing protein [Methylomagnum ishizawai]|uniref:PAS domain S-box-containing protein n=1 Tax=Methylomagnum ishizawai TaxID=1760988 RepID=A0A1Y6D4T4_9GAMM|nr:sigma 54-interacting transcriptional regulator [Methylomagnum ishizawai]SMF97677.1 PAS domain S-box-containing protein [Methylomagnum ishizawai]
MSAADPAFPGPESDPAELATLRALVEGTAQAIGEDFFRALVGNLARATGAAGAFVAEFAADRTQVRSLAFWMDGAFLDTQSWALADTPCEIVLSGQLCHYPAGVSRRFPKEEGVESYLGVPLRDADGAVLGHLAVFDRREMPPEPRLLYTFQIFAARAAAELARLGVVRRLEASEQRFRDLYEEAPIAYVHEDLESRFVSANRAAQRILGLKPEEVPGFVGLSLVPDHPEAQRRAEAAFAALGRGTDTGGVILELRRKDDGRPVWIEWWSRPEPEGRYTRTMFLDITDRVLMEREQARLQAQNRYLREELQAAHGFEDIVGQSPAIRALLAHIRKVAGTDTSVLIQGESGTGKELVARAIHAASPRRDKPLVKLNCAALPTGLVESELFGHEKGAFTGAVARRVGRFELADGGTLFLDEVGELPLDVQAKLLRVLQEREFDRVGGQSPVKVDVRVIAATNRDLARAVADKTFRDDLYYRLNVFPVATPPLRERAGDIPWLVQFMIDKFAPRLGRRIDGIGAASLGRLQTYPWPGNIRELENVIERAIILADGPMLEIGPDLLPGAVAPAPVTDPSLEAVEREHIAAVLRDTDGVIEGPGGAAKVLGLHPSTLRYRMKKLGLR